MHTALSATVPVFMRDCGTYLILKVSKTRLYQNPAGFANGDVPGIRHNAHVVTRRWDGFCRTFFYDGFLRGRSMWHTLKPSFKPAEPVRYCRNAQVLKVPEPPGKFSVLHKIIPYIPAALLAWRIFSVWSSALPSASETASASADALPLDCAATENGFRKVSYITGAIRPLPIKVEA